MLRNEINYFCELNNYFSFIRLDSINGKGKKSSCMTISGCSDEKKGTQETNSVQHRTSVGVGAKAGDSAATQLTGGR